AFGSLVARGRAVEEKPHVRHEAARVYIAARRVAARGARAAAEGAGDRLGQRSGGRCLGAPRRCPAMSTKALGQAGAFLHSSSRSGAWRVNHADVCGNPARGQLNLAGALRDTLLFIVDPTNWPRSVRGLLLSGASSDFVILWTEQCASTAGTQEDTGRSDVRH